MLDTLTRYLEAIREPRWTYNLRRVLLPLCDRFSAQPLTSAGLAISAGGSTVAKIGATDFYAVVQGTLVKIPAGTVLPALTGVIAPAGGFNVACFYVNVAGVVTVAAGAPGATLGAVVFPQPPQGQALIGFLIITSAGAFIGGTTPLDTATTVYISPIGAFDATVLV